MIFNVGAGGASTAEAVQYDNSLSGLEADNVQGALDEVTDSLGGLKFGTDGEGNYGYFGADDSLIPFKSGAEILASKSASQNSTVTLFTATRRIEKPYVVVYGYTAFSIKVNEVEMPLIEFSGQPLSASLGYKQVNATIEKGDVVSWNPRNGGTNYIIMVG